MSRAWVPFYIADFVADTMHLDTFCIGAYMLLLMQMYQHGELPEDDAELSTVAKASPEMWQTIKPKLQKFFYDGWKHKRVEEILAKSRELSETRAASASKRWNAIADAKKSSDANGYAKGIHRARVYPQSQSQKDSLNGELRQESGSGNVGGQQQVYIKAGTEQWNAWANFYRTSRRKLPKTYRDDPDGGWYFPAEWPPDSTPSTT